VPVRAGRALIRGQKTAAYVNQSSRKASAFARFGRDLPSSNYGMASKTASRGLLQKFSPTTAGKLSGRRAMEVRDLQFRITECEIKTLEPAD